MAEHTCEFPQFKILKDDKDGNLKEGMQVLIPCKVCGETPLDHLEFMEGRQEELQAALLAHQPNVPLYHWSPAARRGQIKKYGLRPFMRSTTSFYGQKTRVPYICFADSPSWAWALSGGTRWAHEGEWDLWQTWMDRIEKPIVHATPDRPSGLYEVRSEKRLYKRDLFYVGSRVK